MFYNVNIVMLIIIYCYSKSKLHVLYVSYRLLSIEQRQSSSSSSLIEVHTISPTADYDNFHPSTKTLQIQDCSAYGVVTTE